MTSGAAAVTNGVTPPPRAALIGVALFVVALTTVNALSTLHDIGGRVAAWEPFVWEYTSAVVTLALLPAQAWLLCLAPPGRGRWIRFALAHAPGSLAYSLIHVGGFILLRKMAYAAVGQTYRFGPAADFFYEYRKDLTAYFAIVVVLALAARLRSATGEGRAAGDETATVPGDPAAEERFDIREGAKLIRVRSGEIVAAVSAGNYVEFRLADGRRPLMRTTLAKVEADLSPRGLVRTHRSWLVNRNRVRALTAEGSGDYRLELEGGIEAPLSRRFPDALERLRRPA